MSSNAEGLRRALRWLSERGRHDAAAIDEAALRFDLTPLDTEFLLAERRRLGRDPPADPPAS